MILSLKNILRRQTRLFCTLYFLIHALHWVSYKHSILFIIILICFFYLKRSVLNSIQWLLMHFGMMWQHCLLRYQIKVKLNEYQKAFYFREELKYRDYLDKVAWIPVYWRMSAEIGSKYNISVLLVED